MKECFRDKAFSSSKLDRIELINEIIEDYAAQDLALTLRQLYYQLVSRDVIPNQEREYKNLGKLLSDARLAGLVDWDAIEDRVRRPVQWAEFDEVQDCVDDAVRHFRLPRWNGQEEYVELWVEKDALANVLQPIAAKWHVTMMVNRGYSSQSAMYAAAQRFINGTNQSWHDDARTVANADRRGTLLYLGDHDPSGEDMVRDVKDRLEMLGVYGLGVHKLALTMEQVQHFNPPPNPAKLSDSRASGYVAKHGSSSWEVDALPPRELTRIIEEAIKGCVDVDLMNKIIAEEDRQKAALKKAMKSMEKK